jgi:uncharacterized protein YbjT (DUF2867 family)
MAGPSGGKFTERMTRNEHVTLVLGGNGKTGRRVAARLGALGREVRIGSRAASPAFDWEQPGTWAGALDGISSVYLSYQPDAGFPGAADVIGAFARQAVASGANRIVLLSGRGEVGAQRSEQAVKDSGAALTVVRASFFAQNFSEDFLSDSVREQGVLVFPGGQVAEPFIDVEDIADVAVAALTDDRHIGEVYEVTGPRLLTFDDVVAEISKASGREVHYIPVSPADYRAAMIENGLPPEFATQLTDLFAELMDGHNAYLTDGVQRALGRVPRDFTDFANAAAATGAWSA